MEAPTMMPPPPPSQAYFQTPRHFIAAAVTFLILDLAAITLRFIARRRLKQAIKADDWLMLVGTIFTLAIILVLLWGVSQRGLAYPMEIPPDFTGNPLELVTPQMTATLRTQFTFVTILPLALGFIKLSILVFYFRIFAVTRASVTYVLLAIFTALAGIWTVAFFFAELFQCGSNVWALTSSAMDTITYCQGTSNIDFALTLTGFITDVVIFLVPIPLIWRINLSTGNKLAVSGVFLLGSVTIIASSIRLASVVRLMNAGFDPSMDGILIITEFLYWGLIEAGTGILAGCTPTFQVLFRRALPWDSMLLSLKSVFPSLASSKKSSSADSFDSGSAKLKLGGMHHLKMDTTEIHIQPDGPDGKGSADAQSMSDVWSARKTLAKSSSGGCTNKAGDAGTMV